MKKLFLFLIVLTSSLIANAQINITFQVDVTNLVTTKTILPAGMRIAGTFDKLNATVGGFPMKDFSPSDTSAKMTDLGNNFWSVTVTFPDTAAGDSLQFKFVDGTWNGTLNGTNEGVDSVTLYTDGCADKDISGNINRVMTIPAVDGETYRWCYDHCTQCNGAAPLIPPPPPVNAVNVTFQVDISRLVAANIPILQAGMRIAGNFAKLHGYVSNVAMKDWSPNDTTGRLINMGNYVWATTISFPDSDAVDNDTLQFKFVNGTWYSTGGNEGGASTDDSLILGGCAPASGAAKGNRLFAIPSVNNEVYQWCYDHCTRCDGSPALMSVATGIKKVNNTVSVFSLSPNPAVNGQSTLMYSVNEFSPVSISLYNLLGQQVKTVVNTNRPAGIYNQPLDLSGLNEGIYFLRLTSGNQAISKRIVLF